MLAQVHAQIASGKLLSALARLLSEGDLLLRVRSPAINQARTLEEVAAEIDAAIPFIESSDMMLPQGTPRTKPIWTATNGNARWGVLGEPQDLSHMTPAERVRRLGALEVALSNAAGEQLQRAGMRSNPLQSVLEVLEDLRRRGPASRRPPQPGQLRPPALSPPRRTIPSALPEPGGTRPGSSGDVSVGGALRRGGCCQENILPSISCFQFAGNLPAKKFTYRALTVVISNSCRRWQRA